MANWRPRKTAIKHLYNPKDKLYNTQNIIDQMLNRTQSIFHYENLPETIPEYILELQLQTCGQCFITRISPNDDEQDGLYALVGGIGGEVDIYYRPKLYIISNPRLNESLELRIDKDGVLIKNDTLMCGLLPLFKKYATMMAENELSLYMSSINARIQNIISADNDTSMMSAKEFIKHIVDGDIEIIADTTILDGIRTNEFVKEPHITDLIELQQYFKASLFNEIGLDANYNMKREAINSTEAQMNDDALIPLIDDMLKNRQDAVEKINEMFGTEITVELTGAWRARQEEIEDIIEDNIDDEDVTNDEKTNESENGDNEEDERIGEEDDENEQETDNKKETKEEKEITIKIDIDGDDGNDETTENMG